MSRSGAQPDWSPLVTRLVEARPADRLNAGLRKITRYGLVVISTPYENASIILTSNRSMSQALAGHAS